MKQETLIKLLCKAGLCAVVFLSLWGCGKDSGQTPELPPDECCPLQIGTIELATAPVAQSRASHPIQSGSLGIYVKHPSGEDRWGKYTYVNDSWIADNEEHLRGPIYVDKMGRSEMTIAYYPWRSEFIERSGTFDQTTFRIYPEENISYYNATQRISPYHPVDITLQSIFSLWKIVLSTGMDAAHITQFRGNLGAKSYSFTPDMNGGDPDTNAKGYGTWKQNAGTAVEMKYPLDITISAGTQETVINLLVPAWKGISEGTAKMWLTIDGRELEIPLNNNQASLHEMNCATTISLTLDNGSLCTDIVSTIDWPDPSLKENEIAGTW